MLNMAKKMIASGMIAAMLISPTSLTILAANAIAVRVNGASISFDQPPINENGRVLVPMRAIFEALGYAVEWDSQYNVITATMTDDEIKREVYVHLDQLCMSVYESKIQNPAQKISFFVPLDPEQSPIRNVNGRILLPARAIAETLGCKVDWDAQNQIVIVDTANAKIAPPPDWVTAIEAHSAKYAPDFLALKGSWTEADEKNQITLSGGSTPQPTETAPVPSKESTDKNVYTIYSNNKNREFEYFYKEPKTPENAPVIGTIPADILIDDSHPTLAYPDPMDSEKKVYNLTEPYSAGTTGGCNWYADGRFWEVYGIPIPHFDEIFSTTKYLDGAEKYDEFTVIRDVNAIKPNAIAVYIPTTPDSTPHVLFVEYIERSADGKPKDVYFTEANADNPTGRYRHGIDGAVKMLSFDSFINRGKQRCIGFITPNEEFYK
jgi:hypothetical protein